MEAIKIKILRNIANLLEFLKKNTKELIRKIIIKMERKRKKKMI